MLVKKVNASDYHLGVSELVGKVEPGVKVIVLVVPPSDANSETAHILQEAAGRLKSIVRALSSGYRFDDDAAPRYIDAALAASKVLDEQIRHWLPLFRSLKP